MKLSFVARYFAIVVALIAFTGLFGLVAECRTTTPLPFTYLGFAICLGLLGIAQRLWLLQRWALIVFTLISLLGVTTPPQSYFCLINTIMGLVVLALRWNNLRSGI